MGIIWLGELASPPSTPVLDNAYYNITEGRSYIWDGSNWDQMTEDGREGAFKSTIYRAFGSTPPNPSQTGSYNGSVEVAPSDWSTTPVTPLEDDHVWISTARYYFNGNTWSSTFWSTPVKLTGTAGTSPVKDTDYFDGARGAFISLIYTNAVSPPEVPIGGTFAGDVNTEVFPTLWDDNPKTPNTGETTWVSVRKYQHVVSSDTWTGGAWSTPAQNSGLVGPAPTKGVDYKDADGTFTSYVFRVDINGTTPPVPSNGSYDGIVEVVPTLPTAWRDDPLSPAKGQTLWISKCVYRQTNGVYNLPTWSTPAKFSGAEGYTPVYGLDYVNGSDGSFTSYIFRNATSKPTEAIGGSYNGILEVQPTNWSDNPITAGAGEITWVSKAKYINVGTSLAPVWTRDEILGTAGNWSFPNQFSGSQGEQGVKGVYTALFFKLSRTRPVLDPEQDPDGWSTSQPEGLSDILWGAQAPYDADDVRTGSWLIYQVSVDNDRLDKLITKEVKSREDLAQEVFFVTSAYADFRRNYETRTLNGENLVDAAVYVDPETGLIVNRAYAYTDNSYSEAAILIDGVSAAVTIEANRITASEQKIVNAEAAIVVSAGEINQRATYTEVTAELASALEAITPAYSWQFNSTVDGWTGGSWDAGGYLVTVADTPVIISSISFVAEDNPTVQTRTRNSGVAAGFLSWNGGSQRVSVAAGDPTPGSWITKAITLSEADGWTGTITSIEYESDAPVDIDYFTIGKSSASQLALDDITVRATALEFDMYAEGGLVSLAGDTTWINGYGYQTSSQVDAILDTFDTTYSITATLTELDNEGTILKATSAQSWIDGAGATIRDTVVAYNSENGILDGSSLTQVNSEIDALKGTSSESITSIFGLKSDQKSGQLNQVMLEYSNFLFMNNIEQQGVKIAYADRTLTAFADEQSATASEILTLVARVDDAAADINSTNLVIASDKQATAVSINNLRADMVTETGVAVATAEEYTRTSIGYCLDVNGEITNEVDAVICVETVGNSWVEGALAEFVRNLQISKNGESASINEIRQVFEKPDGTLVARGGMINDVNNRISGFVNSNDGSVSNFDIIADIFNVGVMVEDVFDPMLYLDSTDPNDVQMVLKGRLTLGDGSVIKEIADIRAEDGTARSVEYQYSVAAASGTWHFPMEEGDVYQQMRIVTQKGIQTATYGDWSFASRIKGNQGVKGDNPVVSKVGKTTTITDGDGNIVTVTDGEDMPLPTVTDNGDGTYTVTDGSGTSVIISDGVEPTLGIDYFEGSSGDYISIRFQNVTDGSAVPGKPVDGSFDGTTETPPTNLGWTDDYEYEEGKTTYRTERRYVQTIVYEDGGSLSSWAGGTWSTPQVFAKRGAEGYSPIKGTDYDDGIPGNNVRVEYSADGTSGWAVILNSSTHKYIRTSVDTNGDGVYIPGNATKFIPEKGVEYDDGDPGVSSYLHIKYSNDGTTFTANGGEDLGDYIGTYVDTIIDDSTAFGSYNWKKIVGDQGNPADPVWYKWDGTALLIKVQATQPAGYTQDSGAAIELKGENGITTYTWLMYADDASGNGITNTAGTKAYIGFAYNKTTATESNVPADYSWSQIKGAKGDPADPVIYIYATTKTGTYTTVLDIGDKWAKVSVDNGATYSAAFQIVGDNAPLLIFQYAPTSTGSWSAGFAAGTDYWARSSNDGGTTWSAAYQLVGDKGDPADQMKIQYSVTGTGTWANAFISGTHFFARTSVDGGTTYTSAYRIVGEKGDNAVVYKITLPSGTGIKNSSGSVDVYATKIVGGVHANLGAGSVKLYVGASDLGYYELFDASDINGSVVVELRDGSKVYDSVTLTDVTDGIDGYSSYWEWTGDTILAAGTDWVGQPNAKRLTWVQANDGGAWSPAAVYSEYDTVFFKGAVEIGRQRTVVKNKSNGNVDVVKEQAVSAVTGYYTSKTWEGRNTPVFSTTNWIALNGTTTPVFTGNAVTFNAIQGGTKGTKGDTPTAIAGARGAGRYQIGHPSVAWAGTWDVTESGIAGGVTPLSTPVINDVVTIYNTDNPEIQATRFFQGSGMNPEWETFELHLHGSVLIEGTLNANAIIAGTQITSPKIVMLGTNVISISSATGFGGVLNDRFIEWKGIADGVLKIDGTVDYTKVLTSNAIFYIKEDGDAFFGGTVTTKDSYTNRASTLDASKTPSVSLLGFETRGATISFSGAYSMSAFGLFNGPLPPSQAVTANLKLQELVSSVWTTRKTVAMSSMGQNEEGGSANSYTVDEMLSGSIEHTDTSGDTNPQNWRLTLTDVVRRNTVASAQSLTLVSVE